MKAILWTLAAISIVIGMILIGGWNKWRKLYVYVAPGGTRVICKSYMIEDLGHRKPALEDQIMHKSIRPEASEISFLSLPPIAKGEGTPTVYFPFEVSDLVELNKDEPVRSWLKTRQQKASGHLGGAVVFSVAGIVLLVVGSKARPKNNLDKSGEQDGADQPATAPESKLEGDSKPQPESEGRSQ